MQLVREPVKIEETASVAIKSSTRTTLCRRLNEKWEAIQVGRQGSYSIERLESLDRYCKTVSQTRAILVCILTPLPSLAFALLTECLPLRPPTEGWKANWVFWIRVGMLTFAMFFAIISQLVTCVPELNATLWKRLLVSVGAAAAFLGVSLAEAKSGGFPVKMMWTVGNLLSMGYLPTVILVVFGGNPFSRNTKKRRNLRRFYRFFISVMTLGVVYPLYKLVYLGTSENYRSGVILGLPLWRFGAKHFIMWANRDMEDFLPGIVTFSVDFYNALFVSLFMSTSGSVLVSALFILLDLSQSLLEFHEVRANAKSVLKLLQDRRSSRQRLKRTASRLLSSSETAELMTIILAVTRNLSTFHTKSLGNTRLWACLPHVLTQQQAEQLQALEASGFGREYQPPVKSKRRSTFQKFSRRRLVVAPTPTHEENASLPGVIPMAEDTNPKIQADQNSTSTSSASPKQASIERSKRIVEQGLQLLFHCEYLALVEYVECVIPLMFMTYKTLLVHLPNIVYYPSQFESWNLSSATNILVYALMEVASFVLLEKFLRRSFAYSPLHQLAFALETQVYLVQGSLWLIILALMQVDLVHSGDY